MLQPFLERLVDGDPLPPRRMVGIDRVDRPQLEDRLRVEGERVGLEPVDCGDGDPVRPLLTRR